MRDVIGQVLMRWRIRAVLPHVDGFLLDIGCGTNRLVRSYKGKGIGVDVYQWGEADLIVEDTAHLPYKNGTFDTVTIVAALNHIPNRREVLKEANRLLKVNGRIIITMLPPRISRLWHLVRRPWDADQKERTMQAGEVYGMDRFDVSTLLQAAGFEVVVEKSFMCGVNRLSIGKKKPVRQ